jgi:hypothetical protein
MRLDIPLHGGVSLDIDLTLREAVKIQGKLLMLDDATPHVAVPVQAIRDGEVIATTLSEKQKREEESAQLDFLSALRIAA